MLDYSQKALWKWSPMAVAQARFAATMRIIFKPKLVRVVDWMDACLAHLSNKN